MEADRNNNIIIENNNGNGNENIISHTKHENVRLSEEDLAMIKEFKQDSEILHESVIELQAKLKRAINIKKITEYLEGIKVNIINQIDINVMRYINDSYAQIDTRLVDTAIKNLKIGIRKLEEINIRFNGLQEKVTNIIDRLERNKLHEIELNLEKERIISSINHYISKDNEYKRILADTIGRLNELLTRCKNRVKHEILQNVLSYYQFQINANSQNTDYIDKNNNSAKLSKLQKLHNVIKNINEKIIPPTNDIIRDNQELFNGTEQVNPNFFSSINVTLQGITAKYNAYIDSFKKNINKGAHNDKQKLESLFVELTNILQHYATKLSEYKTTSNKNRAKYQGLLQALSGISNTITTSNINSSQYYEEIIGKVRSMIKNICESVTILNNNRKRTGSAVRSEGSCEGPSCESEAVSAIRNGNGNKNGTNTTGVAGSIRRNNSESISAVGNGSRAVSTVGYGIGNENTAGSARSNSEESTKLPYNQKSDNTEGVSQHILKKHLLANIKIRRKSNDQEVVLKNIKKLKDGKYMIEYPSRSGNFATTKYSKTELLKLLVDKSNMIIINSL